MRKGKKFGKKIARGVLAATLMLSVLGSTASVAQAKTYYSMKYGKWNTGKPWKASSRKAYENDVNAGLGIYVWGDTLSQKKRYDCDGDGKIESIKLSYDYDKDEENVTGVNLSIDGDDVPLGFIDERYCMGVVFYTMELDGEHYGFLLYGDEDLAGGGAFVYAWDEDDSPELIAEYEAAGCLSVYTASEKGTGERYLYIEEIEQISKPSKWPKKYKKWKKKKYTSVTQITYEKYKIEDGSLTSKGKDIYYGIGPSYD